MRSARAILASAVLCLSLFAAPAAAEHCGTPPQATHTYVLVGSAAATTSATDTSRAGTATVHDNDLADCDGDGRPDFDGDHEFGIGGAFFGVEGGENPQTKADCGYDLHLHPGTRVVVRDAVAARVFFMAGYEGWDDAVEPPCETDGLVGDDVEDCLEHFQDAAPVFPCAGRTPLPGQNMDAGIWIFLECHASDAPGLDCATSGTATIE